MTLNAPSRTAVSAPPLGRGSLSGLYCILKAPERTMCVEQSQANLLTTLGLAYLYP